MVASRWVAVDEASEPLGHSIDVGVVLDKVLGKVEPLELRKVLVGGAQQVGQHNRNVKLETVLTPALNLPKR